MSDKKKSAIIKISVEAILRKDTTLEQLIRDQTELIFEPKSANGCVVEHEIIDIKT